RGLFRLRPPTIFVPACLWDLVERLFEVHRRAMDQSKLNHNLVPLEVREEYELRRDLKVRAFRTYHAIPSQGYVIYSVKQKLKQEFIGLPGSEIKQLKLSGVEEVSDNNFVYLNEVHHTARERTQANPMESCPSKEVENMREKLVEENFYLITELGEQGRVRVLLLKLDDPVPRRKLAIVFLHSSYKCKEWLRPLLKVFLSLRFDEDIGKDEIEEKK
ncbi:hypothetical protein ACJX0J_041674, partial [Zea mays]